MKAKSMAIQETRADRVFRTVVYAILGVLLVVYVYPLYFVVIASISDPNAVYNGEVLFYPAQITMEGYEEIFQYRELWVGYLNSVFYTVVGVLINITLTMMAAYALSRREMMLRGAILKLFMFTMFFGGGMIPSYLLVKNLGLLDTRWVLLLNGAVSVYNLIITRTYFQTSIPNELFESAYIDGATEWQTFLKIALPLSGAIIAVMALYAAVGTWGSWYTAFIYITDQKKWPLQLRLRQILILNQTQSLDYGMMSQEEIEMLQHQAFMVYTMKYAIIFIACAPMLVLYPFVQKYFVKGVMIGSLKG